MMAQQVQRRDQGSLPRVGAVVINYFRTADTLVCLESLRASSYPLTRIILLNYCAEEDALFEAGQDDLLILRPPENRGYAGNNNIGLRAAEELGCEWVFIANEDITLEREAIARLVTCVTADPQAAMAGPLVLHADEPGVIQSAGGRQTASWHWVHRGQNEPDEGQFSAVEEVDWLSGCGFLVKLAAIAPNFFDERYFAYYEETDLALGVRRKGAKILFCPTAKIWHKGVSRAYQPAANTTYYMTRNLFLLLAKHRAPVTARMRHWLGKLRTLLSFRLRPKWRGKREHADAIWQGLVDYRTRRWGQRPTR